LAQFAQIFLSAGRAESYHLGCCPLLAKADGYTQLLFQATPQYGHAFERRSVELRFSKHAAPLHDDSGQYRNSGQAGMKQAEYVPI
jgi:hypothetical protein